MQNTVTEIPIKIYNTDQTDLLVEVATFCEYKACKNIEARRQGYLKIGILDIAYGRTNRLDPVDYNVHTGAIEIPLPVVDVWCE